MFPNYPLLGRYWVVPTDGLNSDIRKSIDCLGTLMDGLGPKKEVPV